MKLEDDTHKSTDYKPVDPSLIPKKSKNSIASTSVDINFDMVDNYNLRIFARDSKVG